MSVRYFIEENGNYALREGTLEEFVAKYNQLYFTQGLQYYTTKKDAYKRAK